MEDLPALAPMITREWSDGKGEDKEIKS